MLRVAWAVFRLDLALERATWERLAGMGLFSLLCAVMFHFSVFAEPRVISFAYAGGIWVVFFFASALGMGRVFAAEAEEGAGDALMLSPAPPEAVYAGKTAAAALLLALVQAGVWAAFALFFNAGGGGGLLPARLLLACGGAWALASVGVLVASMSVHARRREMLFPVLFFPLAMPVLMSAAMGWSGAEPGETAAALRLVGACAILYFSLGWMLFPHVVKE